MAGLRFSISAPIEPINVFLVFFQKIQFCTFTLVAIKSVRLLYIPPPPPLLAEVFEKNVQLVIIGDAPRLKTPPPKLEILALKIQFVNIFI